MPSESNQRESFIILGTITLLFFPKKAQAFLTSTFGSKKAQEIMNQGLQWRKNLLTNDSKRYFSFSDLADLIDPVNPATSETLATIIISTGIYIYLGQVKKNNYEYAQTLFLIGDYIIRAGIDKISWIDFYDENFTLTAGFGKLIDLTVDFVYFFPAVLTISLKLLSSKDITEKLDFKNLSEPMQLFFIVTFGIEISRSTGALPLGGEKAERPETRTKKILTEDYEKFLANFRKNSPFGPLTEPQRSFNQKPEENITTLGFGSETQSYLDLENLENPLNKTDSNKTNSMNLQINCESVLISNFITNLNLKKPHKLVLQIIDLKYSWQSYSILIPKSVSRFLILIFLDHSFEKIRKGIEKLGVYDVFKLAFQSKSWKLIVEVLDTVYWILQSIKTIQMIFKELKDPSKIIEEDKLVLMSILFKQSLSQLLLLLVKFNNLKTLIKSFKPITEESYLSNEQLEYGKKNHFHSIDQLKMAEFKMQQIQELLLITKEFNSISLLDDVLVIENHFLKSISNYTSTETLLADNVITRVPNLMMETVEEVVTFVTNKDREIEELTISALGIVSYISIVYLMELDPRSIIGNTAKFNVPVTEGIAQVFRLTVQDSSLFHLFFNKVDGRIVFMLPTFKKLTQAAKETIKGELGIPSSAGNNLGAESISYIERIRERIRNG